MRDARLVRDLSSSPKRIGRPEGRPHRYCLVVVASSPPDFLADFFFVLVVFFIVSPLLMVSPPAAGVVVDVWAKAFDERKARAVVAMIILRMRRPPFVFLPAGAT